MGSVEKGQTGKESIPDAGMEIGGLSPVRVVFLLIFLQLQKSPVPWFCLDFHTDTCNDGAGPCAWGSVTFIFPDRGLNLNEKDLTWGAVLGSQQS